MDIWTIPGVFSQKSLDIKKTLKHGLETKDNDYDIIKNTVSQENNPRPGFLQEFRTFVGTGNGIKTLIDYLNKELSKYESKFSISKPDINSDQLGIDAAYIIHYLQRWQDGYGNFGVLIHSNNLQGDLKTAMNRFRSIFSDGSGVTIGWVSYLIINSYMRTVCKNDLSYTDIKYTDRFKHHQQNADAYSKLIKPVDRNQNNRLYNNPRHGDRGYDNRRRNNGWQNNRQRNNRENHRWGGEQYIVGGSRQRIRDSYGRVRQVRYMYKQKDTGDKYIAETVPYYSATVCNDIPLPTENPDIEEQDEWEDIFEYESKWYTIGLNDGFEGTIMDVPDFFETMYQAGHAVGTQYITQLNYIRGGNTNQSIGGTCSMCIGRIVNSDKFYSVPVVIIYDNTNSQNAVKIQIGDTKVTDYTLNSDNVSQVLDAIQPITNKYIDDRLQLFKMNSTKRIHANAKTIYMKDKKDIGYEYIAKLKNNKTCSVFALV